ncbi:metalloregulator ArsR/SmtB family transcription factor [Dickeya undicola]|uniref:Arsenical resistance operon repressor n=1 Tax=Dickeya undicola TaxID=1577887 RepID=A0A3N0GCQ8_9GAMM|nr:metalloregulator ArsR/SmtB family transcription factor [Dickeya undicola]RNM10229.1 ArsR family transcriptional regulator [Dickeya undicola]
MNILTPLELFKALSDDTRLSIVLLLREAGELCVCDLCSGLQASQPKISRHLAILREAGLLLDRRQGKWIHYRLSPHVPAWCAAVVEQAWLSQRHEVANLVSRLEQKGRCE